VTNFDDRERAAEPQDLGALILEPASQLASERTSERTPATWTARPRCTSRDAVVAAGGELVNGSKAIRRLYEALLADPPQSPVTYARLHVGQSRSDLDPLPRRATAEIARGHSDGTWLWVTDQPNVTR